MTARKAEPFDTNTGAAEKALAAVAAQVAAIPTGELISVQAAISAVMRDLPAIGKTEEAKGVPYKFRGIEAMTVALQPLMARHGLVIVPQAQTIVIDPSPGQKEAWQDVMVKFDWLIMGPDGSHVTASTYGIGRDHTDKGSNKGQTQAYKYLIMHLFCVSDPKDDGDSSDFTGSENDVPPPREPTEAEREVDELGVRLAALKARPDEAAVVKEWAKAMDRSLSPGSLLADDVWRGEVISMLDELDEERADVPADLPADGVVDVSLPAEGHASQQDPHDTSHLEAIDVEETEPA